MRIRSKAVIAAPVFGVVLPVALFRALTAMRFTSTMVMGDSMALGADLGKAHESVTCQADESGQCRDAKKKDEVVITVAGCENHHDLCHFWAQAGECEKNPVYMLEHCQSSCKVCGPPKEWKVQKTPVEEEEDIIDETAFGVKQEISGSESAQTQLVVRRAIEYMKNEVFAKPQEYPTNVLEGCQNRHALCAFWAAVGECENNPGYMKLQCAPSCRTCDRLDFNKRCPYNQDGDPNFPNAMESGDLHRMFEAIVAPDSKFQAFKPKIHSRPYTEGAAGIEGQPLEEGVIEGPWVVTFDEFTTPEEADILIELGRVQGYERSTDVGEQLFDGTYDKKESTGRTSHNAWCKEDCMKNETAQVVMSRIEEVTGIPSVNYESFQLLKYELGQKYNTHHDFIDHQVERQCGPRILTFFLYLSDVEEGGGTNFPRLKNAQQESITVMPRKGKALLWPSALNENLHSRDDRTYHQALPVKAGTKYAANAWIHLRDFMGPNDTGCS